MSGARLSVIAFRPNRSLQIQALAWVWPLVRERRGSLFAVVVLSALASTAALLPPYLTKILIDQGIAGGRPQLVLEICAVLLALLLAGLAVESVSRLTYLRLSAHVLFGLREQLYRHLHSLAPTYYARTRGGEIMSRLDGDVSEVQRFSVDAPLALLSGVFSLLVALPLMLVLSPLLTLLVFALVPLHVGVLVVARPRLEASTHALRRQNAAMSSFFLESLRAMKFIQATNSEARQAAGLRRQHGDYYAALRRSQRVNLAAGGAQRLLAGLGALLVFAVGGTLAAAGELSIGVLVAFIAYAARAAGPIQTVFGVVIGWQKARVSLLRLAELRAELPAVVSPRQPQPLPATAGGALRLDGVAFGYGATPVLVDASLAVAGGSKVALIGASGAGKSTLIDLLQRHYDPLAGRLRLDGVDLTALDLGVLRRAVAVVDQDPVLLPGSVRDNLLFVCPAADEAALRRALAIAGLERFAGAGGLDKAVGDSAFALSRGERLRIALARAVLQQPMVLILDETTASLDLPGAQAILATIDRVFADRTRIVIAHNLASIGPVDRIVELRDGRLFDISFASPPAADVVALSA